MHSVLRKTIHAAFALTLAVAPAAMAVDEPFADLNNNGVFDGQDVLIGALLEDGRFSTDEAEGAYQPPAGPVGIVVPADARKVTADDLVLIASGDVTIEADLTARDRESILLVVSTGGGITVAERTRLKAGNFLKLSAAGDVTVGDRCSFKTNGKDFGDVASLVSQTGNITLGERVLVKSGGLCQVATTDEGGGQIHIGDRSNLSSGTSAVQVTAGLDVEIDGARLTGPNLLVGSNQSVHSPGRAMILGSRLTGKGHDAFIRIYANGGTGSMVDLSDTTIKLKEEDNLLITADQILQ